jgi:putative peptidoglycan lipid II flippase
MMVHARNASIMALGTALSRITGFLRYASLAYVLGLTLRYGKTNLPSTYNLANSVPNMIFDLVVGGILASLFIPVFVEYLATRSREEAYHVASSATNISLLILILVTVVGIFASPLIIRLMTLFGSYSAQGASTEVIRQQATFFLRFFLPQIIFYGLSAIFTGLLNSHRHFTVPAFAPILNNVVVILTVAIFSLIPGQRDDLLHLVVLASGTTLGVAAQALVQIPMLKRLQIIYRPVFDLHHPAIRRIGRLSLPLIGYILLWQVSTWFVFALAIQKDGGVPSYQYAQLFFQLPYGIFAVSIITALFPTLSERAALKTWEGFRDTLSAGIRSTLVVIMPCAVVYLMLNQQIIRLLLEHGFFKAGDTVLLSRVLLYFALGLVPYSVDMLLTKSFYSMQDTRTPMIINCFVVAVNMVANYFLFHAIGVPGLALGFALSYFFSMTVDGLVLRRRLRRMGGRVIVRTLFKTVVASSVMALVIYAGNYLLHQTLAGGGLLVDLLEVVLPLALGGVTYFYVSSALKMEELGALKELAMKHLPLLGSVIK